MKYSNIIIFTIISIFILLSCKENDAKKKMDVTDKTVFKQFCAKNKDSTILSICILDNKDINTIDNFKANDFLQGLVNKGYVKYALIQLKNTSTENFIEMSISQNFIRANPINMSFADRNAELLITDGFFPNGETIIINPNRDATFYLAYPIKRLSGENINITAIDFSFTYNILDKKKEWVCNVKKNVYTLIDSTNIIPIEAYDY